MAGGQSAPVSVNGHRGYTRDRRNRSAAEGAGRLSPLLSSRSVGEGRLLINPLAFMAAVLCQLRSVVHLHGGSERVLRRLRKVGGTQQTLVPNGTFFVV